MKKRLTYLVSIVFIIILSIFLTYQKVSLDIVSNAKNIETGVITEDVNQKIVRQKVNIKTKTIEGIKLKLATFEKIPEGSVQFLMKDLDSEEIIFEKEIKGDLIQDNSYIDIDFKERISLENNNYEFIFDTEGLKNYTPITFYIYKSANENYLIADEIKLSDSSLVLEYYTHEFSIKRLGYLVFSMIVLFSYTTYVINTIIKKK